MPIPNGMFRPLMVQQVDTSTTIYTLNAMMSVDPNKHEATFELFHRTNPQKDEVSWSPEDHSTKVLRFRNKRLGVISNEKEPLLVRANFELLNPISPGHLYRIYVVYVRIAMTDWTLANEAGPHY